MTREDTARTPYAWPDGTPKSQRNAFNWRTHETHTGANLQRSENYRRNTGTTEKLKTFHIYSKAKA